MSINLSLRQLEHGGRMVHGGPFWLHGCRTVCTYAFARLHFLCSRYGRRETQRQSERGRERESNTERTMKRSNNHTETKKLNATGRRCVRTDAHGVFGFLSHPRRATHLRWFFDVTLLKRRRVPTVNPKPHVRLCL